MMQLDAFHICKTKNKSNEFDNIKKRFLKTKVFVIHKNSVPCN